jgi:hypothetical protein
MIYDPALLQGMFYVDAIHLTTAHPDSLKITGSDQAALLSSYEGLLDSLS